MSSRVHLCSRSAPVVAGLLLILAGACGGSSTINVTQPSASKCDIAVSNSMPRVPASGGKGNLTVSTNRECSWSARAEASWITLSGSEGQGPATVAYTVTANANGTARQGAVVVGEQRVALTQDPAPCRYEVSPPSMEAAAEGGELIVSVSAPPGCPWSARSDASWISSAAPASGDGTGAVRFSVAGNAGSPRTGSVAVAGTTVQVLQGSSAQPAPAPPAPAPSPAPAPAPTPAPSPTPAPAPAPDPPAPSCTYAVSPTRKAVAAAGERVAISVTAASGCAWTATSGADWIAVTAGPSGSGSGSAQLLVDRNTAGARTGAVTVAGQRVTIEQAAAPPAACAYSIKPTSYQSGRGPDDINVNVTAGNGCAWTAASQVPWMTVTDGRSGTGNGSVRLHVEPNSSAGSRTGIAMIAGETFTVTQFGCTVSLKPTYYDAGRGPDDIRITVTADAGCTWTTANSAAWVTVAEGQSGSGNGSVRLRVEANRGTPRSVTLTIGGAPFVLRQEGRD